MKSYATQYTFIFDPIELYYADAAFLNTSTGQYINGIVPVDSGSSVSGTFTVNINNNSPTIVSYDINVSASTVASPAYPSGGTYFNSGTPWPNRAPYSIAAEHLTSASPVDTVLTGQAGWHGPSFTYSNGYVFDPSARPSTDIPYRLTFIPTNRVGTYISLWFSPFSTSQLLFGRYPNLSSYGWVEDQTTNPVTIYGFLGPKGAFAGSGLISTPINTTGSTMESSNLGAALDADFQGGTLTIVSGSSNLSQSFNVGNVAGNTVDANGNTTTLSGTLTGAGGLKFTDSSGSANTITLTNSGGNTFSGTTTVSGTTLLAGATNVLSPNSAVQLDDVAQTTLDLNNFNQTINGLSGGGSNGGNISLGSATLTNNAGGTYAGVISGTGAYVQSGGTQIFTGSNTYTGGTTISSGTLQIGNGGTTGSITGDVSNNGTLAFNRSDSTTFSGIISGIGVVQKSGAGTLTLTNTNTYSGGTTISAGTLQIGNGGTTGSIIGNVSNSGTFAFNRSDAVTYAGIVSGSGSLQQNGSGTLTITNANTFTGSTSITAGTLSLTGTGSIATSSGVASSGNGIFDISLTTSGATIASLTGSSSATVGVNLGIKTLTLSNASGSYSGVIGGSGAFTLTSGSQTLSGNNTYTGGSTISAGTLQIGNGGTTGSIVGDVSNSGTLAFNRSDSSSFAGIISGTGVVQKSGAGTLSLTNTNTYSGGTTISAGTLQIGNGGTSGSITGDVTNSGTIAFNRTDALTFAGLVSGSGSLRQNGSGTLILTNGNTYTGGTTISAGTLQIGNGGSTGAISGDVANTGTLVFNRSNASTFAGIVSGTGSLQKIGSGTLNLTATHSYSGVTTINNGTIALSGSGSIANSSGLTTSGAGVFDISATTSGATIKTLSGTSTAAVGINLGGKNLTFSNASGSYSGSIAGSGKLILSAGNQTLTGSNTFTGGVQINSGAALTVNTSAALGTGDINLIGSPTVAAVLNVTSNTTLSNNVYVSGDPVFNIATGTTTTVSSVIADAPLLPAGDLVLNNDGSSSGTLVLTANNTYTGGTIITAGTLQLGNGGTSGSIVGNVTNNAALIFNRSDAVTFSGVVSGSGALKQNGSGVLTLSNANTYSGATTISSGTLALSSSGSISGSSSVTNNGIFDLRSASNSVSLAGSYNQGSAGTLKMVMGVGSSQLLSAGGAVTLDGTLTVTASAGTYTKKHYHLISGTSVTGKFSSFTSNLASYTNLLYGLTYTPTGVDLVVGLSDASNSLKALTSNGNQVRDTLTQRATAITGTMDYDCRDFSAQNLCVNFQARYTGFESMSDGAGVLTIAKNIDPSLRIGGFVDQRVAQKQQTGMRLSGDMPTIGAFIGYTQKDNNTGLQAKLAVSSNAGKITTTRDGSLQSTEAGFGKSNLNSWAIGGELGYGVAFNEGMIATPYIGLRYSDVTRGAYSETATADVAEPVAYADYYQRQTTATAGIRFAGLLTETIGYQLGAGAEFDVGRNANHYSGTSLIGGLETFSINTNTSINRFRANASAGLSYAIDTNQKLTTNVSIRGQAYSSQPSLNTMAGYQISF